MVLGFLDSAGFSQVGFAVCCGFLCAGLVLLLGYAFQLDYTIEIYEDCSLKLGSSISDLGDLFITCDILLL